MHRFAFSGNEKKVTKFLPRGGEGWGEGGKGGEGGGEGTAWGREGTEGKGGN
jgi:hypothetical protein